MGKIEWGKGNGSDKGRLQRRGSKNGVRGMGVIEGGDKGREAKMGKGDGGDRGK